jgi:hypothetical protein
MSMDRADAATLAMKLAGIYAIIEAIKLVPTMALPLRSAIEARGVDWFDIAIIGVPLLLACILLCGLAWFLIARGRGFAERLLGEPRQSTIDFDGNLVDMQAIAFSVVGLVLLTDGLPELIRTPAEAIAQRTEIWLYLRVRAPDLVMLFIELTIGYWLFFMPRTAARLWARWAGYAPDPAERAAPEELPPDLVLDGSESGDSPDGISR